MKRENLAVILLLALQMACTNATVSVNSVNSKFDGISFEANIAKVMSMSSFTIKGQCSPKVLRVYFKIDDASPWQQIDDTTNGKVECASKGTFTLNFTETIAKVTSASGYTKADGVFAAQLIIQVYGEAENLDTLPKTFTAVIDSTGKQTRAISASGSHELVGAGFKIKGHLSNANSGPTLSNGTNKIQSASKELIK